MSLPSSSNDDILPNLRGKESEPAPIDAGHGQSRGYCQEMICADFLAGANLSPESGNGDTLFLSLARLVDFLPESQKRQFLERVRNAS